MKFDSTLVIRDTDGEAVFDNAITRNPVPLAEFLERNVRNAPACADVGKMGALLGLHHKLKTANGTVELAKDEEAALKDILKLFQNMPWWVPMSLTYLLWPDSLPEDQRATVAMWYAPKVEGG